MNERQSGYIPPAQPDRPQPVNTPYAPVFSHFPIESIKKPPAPLRDCDCDGGDCACSYYS